MKNILITGGTGFLGRELIADLNENFGLDKLNVTVLARNEGKLINLKADYPQIKIISGSVEDGCTALKACKGQDTIFHLAAYKHVGLAEVHTYQCTMSNIYGTINLMNGFNGDLFVSISTDKTAKISGVYGASKRIVEQLINERSKTNTKCRYIVPRYGNVMGSTGSVVPRWIDELTRGLDINVTNKDTTRFFFTVSDAVDLIWEAIEKGKSGEPYIKKMRAATIGALAQAVMNKYNVKNRKIVYTQLEDADNMHEYLDDTYCSKNAEKFTVNQLEEMI